MKQLIFIFTLILLAPDSAQAFDFSMSMSPLDMALNPMNVHNMAAQEEAAKKQQMLQVVTKGMKPISEPVLKPDVKGAESVSVVDSEKAKPETCFIKVMVEGRGELVPTTLNVAFISSVKPHNQSWCLACSTTAETDIALINSEFYWVRESYETVQKKLEDCTVSRTAQ